MTAEMFGIDIGGSGIKGARVDVSSGELLTQRYKYATPQPSVPGAVMNLAAEMVREDGWDGPVGCTFPAVVTNGVVRTAANVDQSWIGTDGRALLADRLGTPVTLLNDADAAAIAEMRFGAGRGEDGVVLVLTFGTGIGSGMFFRGTLVPNTEFGHIEFRGDIAERYCASKLVESEGLAVSVWATRVNEYLHYLERVFSPDLFIFGGGISKKWDDFSAILDTRAPITVATLRNNAGIVGAAMAAHENTSMEGTP